MADLGALLLSFDTETTGTDVGSDRVVQLGAAWFEGRRAVDVRQMKVDPGVPIPPAATAVHGIRDEDVRGKPRFAEVGARLALHLSGEARGVPPPHLLGYNAVSYDVPLLNAEFARHGLSVRIDPARVLDPMVFVSWHLRGMRSRKLTDVSASFGLAFEGAHSAAADAKATGALLFALEQKGFVPSDVDEALALQADLRTRLAAEWAEFSWWLYRDRESGELRLGSGKHCGKLLDEADPSYLAYFLREVADLPPRVRDEFQRRGRAA